MKEYLLNRIWEEMKQVNTNMYYAEIIRDRQTKIGKYKDFIITIFFSWWSRAIAYKYSFSNYCGNGCGYFGNNNTVFSVLQWG
ncbi:MAG: hypothetical protein LBE04_05915 [Prevotellaceae bacterium]|nr:hypothetical protein [Prevotellaceae bacterium]